MSCEGYDLYLTIDRTKRTVAGMSEKSTSPTSIPDLIERFGSIANFAKAVGCGYEAARKFKERDSIAPKHWPVVIAAAESHGIAGVTPEWLMGIRSRQTA